MCGHILAPNTRSVPVTRLLKRGTDRPRSRRRRDEFRSGFRPARKASPPRPGMSSRMPLSSSSQSRKNPNKIQRFPEKTLRGTRTCGIIPLGHGPRLCRNARGRVRAGCFQQAGRQPGVRDCLFNAKAVSRVASFGPESLRAQNHPEAACPESRNPINGKPACPERRRLRSRELAGFQLAGFATCLSAPEAAQHQDTASLSSPECYFGRGTGARKRRWRRSQGQGRASEGPALLKACQAETCRAASFRKTVTAGSSGAFAAGRAREAANRR